MTAPEKIILISTAYPYRGGIAATTDRLAKEYVDRGHEVEVWTYKVLYPSFLFPGKSQYLDLDKHAKPTGYKIERKLKSMNPFNWFKIGRQLKKERNVKVIIRYWLPFLAPCLGTIAKIGKSRDKKILCLVDNVIPHEKRMGDTFLSRYFFKKMDGFVVMAKNGIEELQEHFKIKQPITYSPHPIFDIYGDPVDKEKSCQQLGLDPNRKYILFFGLIRKYKGLDLLLKASAQLFKENNQYDLIIAGESYEDWANYEKLISDVKLNDRIKRFDQFIADEDVKYFFGASEFLALTYHTATQSGVTQIAYSLETPMLVTNVGDLANMVKHDLVGQVTEKDIESIITALNKMMNEANIATYRDGIKKEKIRFEWSKLCDSLDQL